MRWELWKEGYSKFVENDVKIFVVKVGKVSRKFLKSCEKNVKSSIIMKLWNSCENCVKNMYINCES